MNKLICKLTEHSFQVREGSLFVDLGNDPMPLLFSNLSSSLSWVISFLEKINCFHGGIGSVLTIHFLEMGINRDKRNFIPWLTPFLSMT